MTQSLLQRLEIAAKTVSDKLGKPDVGVVLGSGLGGFAERLSNRRALDYAEVPGMPQSGVSGHAGRFCLGEISGVSVACLQGRVHGYEGHPVASVVFGVRLLAKLGCKAVLLSNAAGGVDPSLAPGSLMLITDHLNLTGSNPLLGGAPGTEDLKALGPRFVDMSYAYDRQLQQQAKAAASSLGVELREGVYAGMLGPSYETPAEVRMLRGLGASAVGMSTVLEVIALRQMDVRVGAISCITNAAAGVSTQLLNHAEVKQIADAAADRFEPLMQKWAEAAAQ